MAVSPDGNEVATASIDGSVRRWDLTTGRSTTFGAAGRWCSILAPSAARPGSSRVAPSVNITTTSFPSEPFVKFSFGTSYNDKSNLKNNFLADPDASMSPFRS